MPGGSMPLVAFKCPDFAPTALNWTNSGVDKRVRGDTSRLNFLEKI